MYHFIVLLGMSFMSGCIGNSQESARQQSPVVHTTLADIPLPYGYQRIPAAPPDKATFFRSLPLKKNNTVYLYNGDRKLNQSAQYAVLHIDVGDKDLQQCADAVMRLHAEYLWKQKRFDEIRFYFTNGFLCDYDHYRKGYRLKINGNNTSWHHIAKENNGYATFRDYLDLVYSYAGTRSLHGQLRSVRRSVKPGDIFIQTGNPYGHAVTVMDVAYNPSIHDTIFLLSQSYMPAQDIHVLKNPNDSKLSPWYSSGFTSKLETPEWTFYKDNLMCFD
ncbi:MAG TPA: DUF4846 domain-containing protein [Flavipsychrobacter sp.]|nr:DUF4846 domain-containing protein [Flavipsychrobacter sp.]